MTIEPVVIDKLLRIVYLPRIREIVGSDSFNWVERDGMIFIEGEADYTAIISATAPDDYYVWGTIRITKELLKSDLDPHRFVRALTEECKGIAEMLGEEWKKHLEPL